MLLAKHTKKQIKARVKELIFFSSKCYNAVFQWIVAHKTLLEPININQTFVLQNLIHIFAPFEFGKNVKTLEKYSIDIFGLSANRHEYTFEVGDAFFEAFGGQLVEKGNLQVQVSFDKTETMITAVFHVKGVVDLVCDRSLENFDYLVDTTHKMIYKFGEAYEEVSDEICIIAKDAQKISIAQPIYDFIALALPMKRIHPKFEDIAYPEDTNGLLVYSSLPAEEIGNANETESTEEDIDPRWAALRKLKGSDN